LKGLELSVFRVVRSSLDGPLDLMDVIPPDPLVERTEGAKRDRGAARHTDTFDGGRSRRKSAEDVQPIHGR